MKGLPGRLPQGSARLTPPEVDNFSMGLGQEAAHEIDGEAQEPRRIGAGSGQSPLCISCGERVSPQEQ